MPEGPEVRRHADALHAALAGHRLAEVDARTKPARAWLAAHPGVLAGRRVERVVSHGKHLVGHVEGGLYFHSHLMMWGRWQTFGPGEPVPERDRRERARLVSGGGAAILLSAPVFGFGEGDPYAHEPALATLGPDILPYERGFDAAGFLARLAAHPHREVGAALLDQRIVAGLGNYLRAELLFVCRLSPFARVDALTPADLTALAAAIPPLARRAYAEGGVTLAPADADRAVREPALVYAPGAAWGRRHYVFRRTNLPCFVCGTAVRQLRQVTREPEPHEDAEAKKERITYFCPTCQGVDVPAPRRRRPAPASPP